DLPERRIGGISLGIRSLASCPFAAFLPTARPSREVVVTWILPVPAAAWKELLLAAAAMPSAARRFPHGIRVAALGPVPGLAPSEVLPLRPCLPTPPHPAFAAAVAAPWEAAVPV